MTPTGAANHGDPGLPGVVVQPVCDLPLAPGEEVDVVVHRCLDASVAEPASEVRQDRVPVPPGLDGLGDVEARVGVAEGVRGPLRRWAGVPRSFRDRLVRRPCQWTSR
jgi:hypothetical protein